MSNTLKCSICGKIPSELYEYVSAAEDESVTPEQYVIQVEGTFNPANNLFYCTECYVKIGMPLGKAQSMDMQDNLEEANYDITRAK